MINREGDAAEVYKAKEANGDPQVMQKRLRLLPQWRFEKCGGWLLYFLDSQLLQQLISPLVEDAVGSLWRKQGSSAMAEVEYSCQNVVTEEGSLYFLAPSHPLVPGPTRLRYLQ
jgi:hypothetical protein